MKGVMPHGTVMFLCVYFFHFTKRDYELSYGNRTLIYTNIKMLTSARKRFCVWHRLHVFTSSPDWLVALLASVAIGQSN